jgi:5'-3' exoribonuclease 2
MQVFANIFEYIDRLVAISRPRSLIYMAIDGVAPRAKMNQQRSRRFRAAQDREEQQKVEAKLREKYAEQGIFLPEPKEGETFDSNVITPGTEFMDRLAIVLQWCLLPTSLS